jgi:imidazolonepropionase-like amidohydrolase
LAYPGSGPTGDSVVRNDVPYSITTAEQGRAAVRDLAPKKPSFVKIWVDDRNGTKTKLSPEMYAAIIDEAHKNNLGVIAHVYSIADVKGLIRAGVDGLFHGGKDSAVDDELLGLLKQHPNVWLAPGGGARADADLSCSNFRKLKAAGQKMVLGSDSQPGPQLKVGLKGHQELVHLVECGGLTPAEAIVAATRDTAALLKLDELGTVASGKSADFIVLDADPLQNIANSQRISMVYLRGEKVDRSGLEAKWKARGAQYE